MTNLIFFLSLRRLHDEINSATQREKDTLSALRDAEDVLGKRRSDIQRMRDQVRRALSNK